MGNSKKGKPGIVEGEQGHGKNYEDIKGYVFYDNSSGDIPASLQICLSILG